MLEIARADMQKSLRQDNPWWVAGHRYGAGIRLQRAQFSPFAALTCNWNLKRSVIVMGPRRVGKTVMLYQLIERMIRKGFDGKRILYLSVDTPLYSDMPLQGILELFEAETGHDPDARRVVIFDEIQHFREWEIHLKVLTDRYPNTRFVASGSAAAALKLKSHESGAGRFTEFLLPPLTFAEFLALRGHEETLIHCNMASDPVQFSTPDIQRLNGEFIDYLNFGGYPEAVVNVDIQSNVHRFLGRDIIDKVLLRDLPSLYGIQDVQELNRLFARLAYHTGCEISLEGLAQSSGLAKNTIMKYLEYLEAAFLIARVRRVDETGKPFRRMRNFKVYLTNPAMRSALFAPIEDGDEALGALAETAAFSQWFGSDRVDTIHYARWKQGRTHHEVDFVRVDPLNLQPRSATEIKWSDHHSAGKAGGLQGLVHFARHNRSHTLTLGATSKTLSHDTVLDGVKIWRRPCALFCYHVGKTLASGEGSQT